MTTDIDTSNAIIYGLLAQEEPLTRDDMRSLQKQLNSQGIDSGNPDGFMGENTAGAIGEFLRSPEHRGFISHLSKEMKSDLDDNKQGKLIQRLEHQNNLPDAGLHNVEVLDALDNGSLSKENISKLQESLNSLGHDTKGTSGTFGTKTAEAIVDYLGDNLGALATIEPSILLEAMKKGQTSELKELMNRPELHDLIDSRINETLSGIDDLATTTDHGAVHDLQTLLALGGYAPGGIDGIVGGKTLSSVDRYEASQNPEAVVPNPKPEIVTPTAIEFKATAGTLAKDSQYSSPISGDNGYGVANIKVEKAWAKTTATTVDDGILSYDGDEAVSSLEDSPDTVVVLDFGHGSDIYKDGKPNDIIDPGAVSKDGLSEVDVIDVIGPLIAEELHKLGHAVVTTRNAGEQLRLEGTHTATLTARSDFAQNIMEVTGANNLAYISLHANSFEHRNPDGTIDKVKSEKPHGSRVYYDVDGANKFNPNSADLSESIATAYSVDNITIEGDADITDKQSSVKQVGNLSVLDRAENIGNQSSMAASLVELGFLSNPNDLERLREIVENPEVAREAAKAIAMGIHNYIDPENTITPDMDAKQDATAPAPAPLMN